MIGLELAKKLKEAGLEWEPQIGDMFYFKTFKDWGIDAINSEDVNNNLDETRDFIEEGFWILAPRLDQLLAEIEKRGFIWALDVSATNGNKVIGYAMNIATSLDWEEEEEFRSDFPEEAATEALLWICDRGADRD